MKSSKKELKNEPRWDIEYLVFSGGGIRALSYIAVWRVLCAEFESRGRNLSKQLKGFAGSSAGAFMALLLCLGCTDLFEEILSLDSSRILQALDITNLYHNWGLNDRQYIISFTQKILEKYIHNPHITFSQLFKQTGKELTVTAVRVNDSQVVYFSHATTPNHLVWEAICASMAIPFLFVPVKIGADIYVDGGFLDNVPLYIYPVEKTLGIWLTRSLPYNIEGGVDYMYRIAYLCIDAHEKLKMDLIPAHLKSHILEINTGSYSSINFLITPSQKRTLLYTGALQTLQYIYPNLSFVDIMQKFLEYILHTLHPPN